jgi:N-acetylglutamate synthase-like GNAT family acetyltransferase
MSDLIIRQAGEHDAEALWSLIHSHQREGHLLPRELSELRRHASRFLVAEIAGK